MDHRRRSFVGITLARAATRPFNLLTSTYLALLVAERTSSAVAITFALTAHRYVHVIVLPVAGRLSDRSRTRFGRRIPWVVGSLAVAALGVLGCTVADSYWVLVVCIVIARTAGGTSAMTRIGLTPDVFGRNRWIAAAITVSIATVIPGVVTLGVVRSTWDQDDPGTWDLTFLLAAAGLLIASLSFALLVRESPHTAVAAERAASRSWREELDEFLSRPNARVMLSGAVCLIGAGAAVDRLFPVWASESAGLGGSQLADVELLGAVTGVLTVPLGIVLSRRAHPRVLIVSACVVGAAMAFAHVAVGSVASLVVVAAVAVPLTVAAVAANVPAIVKLIPKAENTTETVGFLFGPLGLLPSVLSYLTAVVVDATGDYNVIWVVCGAFVLLAGVAFSRLQVPADEARFDVIRFVGDLRRSGSGGERGLGRVFGGAVTEADVVEADVVAARAIEAGERPTGPRA